ncbi:hypothetical protein SGLAM104S_08633 [Streptomyces glaucescens]
MKSLRVAWTVGASSPRALLSTAATASWTAAVKKYTPTTARSLTGCSGFSTSRSTRPVPSTSATPKARGSATLCTTSWAAGRRARNSAAMSSTPSESRLSPRYMTKSSSPRNSREMATQCASPRGASCGMYVSRTPNSEPSPRYWLILSGRSPTTTPISRTPRPRNCSMTCSRTGLLASGISCLGIEWLNGRSRSPMPPDNTSAFTGDSLSKRGVTAS